MLHEAGSLFRSPDFGYEVAVQAIERGQSARTKTATPRLGQISVHISPALRLRDQPPVIRKEPDLLETTPQKSIRQSTPGAFLGVCFDLMVWHLWTRFCLQSMRFFPQPSL